MTKKTRTILFIICVFLFVLAAPMVILYSQGYRFDFEEKRIVQTGGLYFKVLPGNADIYLNGKFKDGTSFFTNSLLIENLIPKNYQIEIKKQGYYPWQKNLEVRARQVTEAKNIILLPKEPNFTILDQQPLGIISQITISATSSDKKKIIERANDYEIWILFLEEEKKVFLTRFSEKIGHIFWLTDYYLIFNVGNKIKVAEIDNRDRINMIDLVEFAKPEIFWSGKDKKLYILSEGKLYLSESLLP